MFEIYNAYFEGLQYAVVIISSNIGFIVHCYYSKMYREAAVETFASLKSRVKQLLCRWLPATLQTAAASNIVHPAVEASKNEY